MQADGPKLPPGLTAPAGAWLWSRAAGDFLPVPAPARFELHAIAETDPRFHTLVRGERVEVASPALLLWAPDYVPAERIRHRGPVAIAVDATASDRATELWLDGKPYVFLRPGDADPPAWLGEHRSGRAVWFTYDGATLHALLGIDVDGDGRLVVDLERITG